LSKFKTSGEDDDEEEEEEEDWWLQDQVATSSLLVKISLVIRKKWLSVIHKLTTVTWPYYV
jgi:hypothetical protein